MDELKSLNLTLGFYFFKNLKNLNSDFLGFLGFFLKTLKNLGFLKPCQTALPPTHGSQGGSGLGCLVARSFCQ